MGRKLEPGSALDRQLHELRARGGAPIEAIKLIRERLGVPLGEAKMLLSRHEAWAATHSAAEPVRDAAERAAAILAAESRMTVKKEFVHEPSVFYPPDQDQYRYEAYEFTIDGRIYRARRYDGEDDAAIVTPIRDADDQALLHVEAIAHYLVSTEGVRQVTRYNTRSGVFDLAVPLD